MKQKILNLLKANAVAIILFIVVVVLMWRNNVLNEQKRAAEYSLQTQSIVEDKKIILDSLSKLYSRIKDNEVKSKADSIIQYETIKKNGKPYQNNLTHNRLIAIRDSLRKIAR